MNSKNQNFAVGNENVFSGITIKSLKNKDDIHMALSALIPNHIQNNDIVFVCIGTDRSTGDSLGPLVGMYLKGLGYPNVYGTIDDPVHAMNLEEIFSKLPKDKIIFAIDACLGAVSNVGYMQVIKGSIRPGAGVGKGLPPVGDYAISGTVNVGGFMEYFVLQNTRLSLVMKMAKDITSAIVERFPLEYTQPTPKKRNVKDDTLLKKLKKMGLNAALS